MPLVLGSAGHIDHGKTTLVRALTGIDCDRLEEEKRRGITIELGFAHCLMPNGERLGIVDVPGHERFVKNMVAGAGGIDFVMLVIAADEGVMPQTREHLEICSLLGIRHGFVALTKIDMVDEAWIELVTEDISAFLQDTFLADAPILPVSSSTGQGLDAVKDYIFHAAATLAPQRESSVFRLPVDRIFTMKGHGTVITGTVIAGDVKVGDEAVLMPEGTVTRVRSLQWHGNSVEHVGAGQRCAVNVQAVDVDSVQRGAVLAHAGTLFPSKRWLVMLQSLKSAPRALRSRTEVHFHHGAREVAARLYFFDRDRLQAGESALAEVRFTEPMVGLASDRCVVRAYSPLRTVAGGVLVSPVDMQLKRKAPDFEERFSRLIAAHEILETWQSTNTLATLCELANIQLFLAGIKGVSFAELMVLTNAHTKHLEKALQSLAGKGHALCFDKEEKCWIHGDAFAQLIELCLSQAAAFHQRDPLKAGMARGVLCPSQTPKLAHMVIERCLRTNTLVTQGDVLRLATHKITLNTNETQVRNELLSAHEKAGLTPPNLKDVLEVLKVDAKSVAPVLKLLVDEKKLVKVKDGLYYAVPVMVDICARVQHWFDSHDDLDLAGLKEILGGISRKYLIALLEYMDRERITLRVGDKRQWRGKALPF